MGKETTDTWILGGSLTAGYWAAVALTCPGAGWNPVRTIAVALAPVLPKMVQNLDITPAPLPLLLTVWLLIAAALATGLLLLVGWWRRRHDEHGGGDGLSTAKQFERRNARAELNPDPEPFALIGGRGIHEPVEDNGFVLAPSGQGKTARVLVRWIVRSVALGGALVATSTKPDIVRLTARFRATIGQVWVFDPQGVMRWPDTAPGKPGKLQPPKRARWDIVAGCQYDKAAMDRAIAITAAGMPGRGSDSGNTAYFRKAVETLLRCYLHAAALEGLNMRDVLRWAADPTLNDPYDILRTHPNAKPGWLADLRKYTRGKSEETNSNITSTLAGVLDAFALEEIVDSVCPEPGEGFDIDTFLDSADTIYLLTPSGGAAAGAPVITALVDAIQRAALDKATRTKNGVLTPRLTNALDEIPNVCPIPCLETLMTDGRGHGIRTMGVAQDRNQLYTRYSREEATTIIGQASFFIQLGGSTDVDHLRELATLAGHHDVEHTSTTSGSNGTSTNTSNQREERLPVSRIRELPAGQALLLYRELPPTIAHLPGWWETTRTANYDTSQAWVLEHEGHTHTTAQEHR